MVVNVEIGPSKFMRVRIENGYIAEIEYEGSTSRKTAKREEKHCIEWWLECIIKADVEKFKKILLNIKEDKEFFEYGKQLLDTERMRKLSILEEVLRETAKEVAKRYKDVRRYELP